MANKKLIYIGSTALAVSLGITTSAYAAVGYGARAVVGSVKAISGTSITVDSVRASSTTVYTVDASNARIIKEGTSTDVSNIQVGDKIVVQGTIDGTTVAAKAIIDGSTPRGIANRIIRSDMSESIIKGDLKKVARHMEKTSSKVAARDFSFGTVSAIGGTSFSINTTAQGTTTTIQVTPILTTQFKLNGKDASSTALAIGQKVVVVGSKDAPQIVRIQTIHPLSPAHKR